MCVPSHTLLAVISWRALALFALRLGFEDDLVFAFFSKVDQLPFRNLRDLHLGHKFVVFFWHTHCVPLQIVKKYGVEDK